MPGDRARPKRLQLNRVPRKQWDNLHPGPIATKIKPNLVDRELIRYKIRAQTEKEIFAWVRLPSDIQMEQWCVACGTSKHSENNPVCTGKNPTKGRAMARAMKPFHLYPIKDPTNAIEGKWKRVEFVVQPKYHSGVARFIRVP